MGISLDGYDYGTAAGKLSHGALVVPAFTMPENEQVFWGVLGAAVNYSKPTTRLLTLECTFANFTTEAQLRGHIAAVQSHVADNGTLQIATVNWLQCGFLGFDPSGPPFREPHKHGWTQFGTLRFKQIAF